MFTKERELFAKESGTDILISYKGYDLKEVYDRFIEIDKTRDIFIDFETDFLSFDHFFRFTLVKVFKNFIRTKRTILTVGQLVKYLKMIDFDKEMIDALVELIRSDKSPERRFSESWELLLKLAGKINVKRIVISNFDLWKKSSLNRTVNCEKVLYHIIKRIEDVSVRTIIEVKDDKMLSGIFDDDIERYELNFWEHGIVEDFYYYEYYGELKLCLDREEYEVCKDKVRNRFDKYISNARGGNQLLYVSYLLALSGANGMLVSELANLLGITPGACGSVLKRLFESAVVKREGKRYLIKNNAFRKIILETY